MPVDHVKRVICDFFSVTDIRGAEELFRAELVRTLRPDLATAADLSKQVVPELPTVKATNAVRPTLLISSSWEPRQTN